MLLLALLEIVAEVKGDQIVSTILTFSVEKYLQASSYYNFNSGPACYLHVSVALFARRSTFN